VVLVLVLVPSQPLLPQVLSYSSQQPAPSVHPLLVTTLREMGKKRLHQN
jgi:hypothetical protein